MSARNDTPKHAIQSEMTDHQKSAHIRKIVSAAGDALRQRHPWLRHQNTIGSIIMLLSLLGMIASGYAYIKGLIVWWVCVPITAFFASLIHELEHDLIHFTYFRKHPKINDFMLWLCWIARASTVNPLTRRDLHLNHHKNSGTESDLEERGIANGFQWGWRRLLMTGDNHLAIYLRPKDMVSALMAFVNQQKPKDKKERIQLIRKQLLAYFPLGNLYYLIFHGWIITHAVLFLSSLANIELNQPAWFEQTLHYLNIFAVIYMLPAFLRTFCLHFISSNVHYYGDVEPKNVMQQCQVVNRWWLWPMQLFCFNFGSTHLIHHFVVREPFYIRQWTAKTAHKVMREMGVRFNDFGTFRRNNRFHDNPAQIS